MGLDRRFPTSPHPRCGTTTEGCKCCGVWEGLGVEMEGGAVSPTGAEWGHSRTDQRHLSCTS